MKKKRTGESQTNENVQSVEQEKKRLKREIRNNIT